MINYRCQARCGHCLYHCSPEREPDILSDETAARVFVRAKELGAPSMHISGGEPFLDLDRLCHILDIAKDCGMPIDYIETSASWATTAELAQDAVQRVHARGVGTLSISVAPYLNEYIPLDCVFTLSQACREEGVNPSLWIDEFFPDVTAFPTDTPHSRAEYEALFGKNYWAELRPRYALNMVGRALLTHAKDMPTVPTPRIPHMTRSCAELGGRSHCHFDCSGGYIPPGCPGLMLPLDALGKELNPEEFPVYTRLAQDPKQLLEFCKTSGFVPHSSYYNRCHLCQDMRVFLWRTFPGRFRELAPAGFYEAVLRETPEKQA